MTMKVFGMQMVFAIGLMMAVLSVTRDYDFWVSVALYLPISAWSAVITNKVFKTEKE